MTASPPFCQVLPSHGHARPNVSSPSVRDKSICSLSGAFASLVVAAATLVATTLDAVNASAQEPSTPAARALPGSPRPAGAGLSPEAPQSGPAAGGRAPSFGAPTKRDALAFNLGGSIFAFATMVASFLLGIAIGSLAASQIARTRRLAFVGFVLSQVGIALCSGLIYLKLEWLLPERAGYYLGHRMTEAAVRTAGLAEAVGMGAGEFETFELEAAATA